MASATGPLPGRFPHAPWIQSLGPNTVRLYGRLRASRALMSLLALAVTVCWMLSRLDAYTALVQNKRQQVMSGFGVLMSAAMAPSRYFPWYGDLAAAVKYEAEHDIFRDYRPFRRAEFAPTVHVLTEKGIVIAMRIASRYFGSPANAATLIAMQLALDLLVLYASCFLLWRWGGPVVAIAGGLYYASATTVANAATFPFYYYWPIPFGVLLCLVAEWAARRGRTARLSVAIGLGVCAGYWLLFRATAVLIPVAIAGAFLAARVPLRRVLLLTLFVVFLQQAPALLITATAPKDVPGGLGRSNIWHSLYIGIGTRPNPYGITFSDSSASDMIMSRYKIPFQGPGYEAALKREYLRILVNDPALIGRNAIRNFAYAVLGRSLLGSSQALGGWFWLPALAGLSIVVARPSNKTFPFALACCLWLTQCATLAIACRPQESYLWETMAIAALAGFGGLGITIEWALGRHGWEERELQPA